MSKIELRGHDAPSVFIINTLAKKYGDELFTKFGLGVGNTTVDVVLTINGESMDFLDALHDILLKFDDATERAVTERAKEMVSSSRLDALSRKLSEFEWQIEEELNSLRK